MPIYALGYIDSMEYLAIRVRPKRVTRLLMPSSLGGPSHPTCSRSGQRISRVLTHIYAVIGGACRSWFMHFAWPICSRRHPRRLDRRDQGPRCDLPRHPHRSVHHPYRSPARPNCSGGQPSSWRVRALPGTWGLVCHEQTRRRLVEPSIIKTSPPLVRDAHRTHG